MAAVDLAFFSQALHHAQHPQQAIAEAHRILKPGGRIVVLDLLRHNYQEARDVYADVWFGFTEAEVGRFLRGGPASSTLRSPSRHREEEVSPLRDTLAVGDK